MTLFDLGRRDGVERPATPSTHGHDGREGVQHRYAALDGLRGVAALAVALYHNCILIDRNFAPHSYLAVDLFFMMSGFVLDKAYTHQLKTALPFRMFVTKRAIRLYPMIFLGALLGCVAALLTGNMSSGHLGLGVLAALLVLPFPSDGASGYVLWRLDPPAWSLFWEIAVNLLFGFWMFRLSTRALTRLLAVGVLAVAAVAFGFRTLEVGYLDTNVIGGPARVLFGFTAGVLLSRVHTDGRLPVWRSSIGGLAAAAFVVLAFPFDGGHGAFDLLAVTVIFPVLIVVGVNTPAGATLWRKAGEISYPLYLIHYPILVAFTPLFVEQPRWIKLCGCFGLLAVYVIAAQAALVLFDEPVRARLGRVLATRRARHR
jgi:peptidoglycan/LPS O-acetylase OafA/YrhL